MKRVSTIILIGILLGTAIGYGINYHKKLHQLNEASELIIQQEKLINGQADLLFLYRELTAEYERKVEAQRSKFNLL